MWSESSAETLPTSPLGFARTPPSPLAFSSQPTPSPLHHLPSTPPHLHPPPALATTFVPMLAQGPGHLCHEEIAPGSTSRCLFLVSASFVALAPAVGVSVACMNTRDLSVSTISELASHCGNDRQVVTRAHTKTLHNSEGRACSMGRTRGTCPRFNTRLNHGARCECFRLEGCQQPFLS